MSNSNKNVDGPPGRGQNESSEASIAISDVASHAGSSKTTKTSQRVSSSSERQIKYERAQRCLENAALVSKRIKEHRKATAELLGRPFEDDDGGDTASEMASTMSEKTGYSTSTDVSAAMSVQDALNIPGISESLANTLKQKELLMERIKQYKEISKRPIIKSSPISRKQSVTDSKEDVPKTPHDSSDVTNLQIKIKEKENALSIMQVKMKAMENTIIDLQEKIDEKDQIIEAKTKATSLMSDNLSKKEKESLDLLDDTRQQMTKMQENFIAMESEWKEEREKLLKEIATKDEKIHNLEEANTILENSRFEISVAHSKLAEELELSNKQLLELQQKLSEIEDKTISGMSTKISSETEEKGKLEVDNMTELTKKIELLEQLNCQIRQTNKELENKLASTNVESKSPVSSSPSKKASPVPSRKGGRNTAAKMKSPWSNLSSESLPQETDKKVRQNEITKLEMVIQSLNKDILDKEYEIAQKNTLVSELTIAVSEKETIIQEITHKLQDFHSSKASIDVGILTDTTILSPSLPDETDTGVGSNVNPIEVVKILEASLKTAEDQIKSLNEEIESANKNMIKVKSNHKLKAKQMQKTIDNLSKVSDSNAEIIKLNEEIHQLSQKVAELEEEKGNLQLHLVDYDSGRLTESDTYKKMVEMENLAETRLKAISILETQKFDLVQELHDLQQKYVETEDKLADILQTQNEQVCSEIKSVQLEEQIDALLASKKELELLIDNIKLDKDQLNTEVKQLKAEKQELSLKLEHYIQENMELTDRLEKLSAEKVSSAESIEIVESLTTQEKLELEEYNKMISVHNADDRSSENYKETISNDRNEIEKLVQESAELNRKIELFTQERQEVMERLSKLTFENESLQEQIHLSDEQVKILQHDIDEINTAKKMFQELNDDLNKQIEELKRERIDIIKEVVDSNKPLIEETDVCTQESVDEKSSSDKGNNKNKTVKQLTKEILKLKNTIKEREAEIADCQMKILSMEELQQKQKECVQTNTSHELKLQLLSEENKNLKEEIDNFKKNNDAENQLSQITETNKLLQQEIIQIQQEYKSTINLRDVRVQELESILKEYENQIYNYSNTLQTKEKELTEYLNQITKLNDISQKLKSTIEMMEEEKSKDQNAELVKSLNKQLNIYQKKLSEMEERLRFAEEEKAQLISLKLVLESKNKTIDTEVKSLQESISEKQNLINDLQSKQEKHREELSERNQALKERDEEIHEIKLQLRKESIENEKLRTIIDEKDKLLESYSAVSDELDNIKTEKDELNALQMAAEARNKELMEKLKKFAANLKKKTVMYHEMENLLKDTQKELEFKKDALEQLSLQVESLPATQEKLKYAEEELNRILSQKVQMEQNTAQLQNDIKNLQEKLVQCENEIFKLNESYNQINIELNSYKEQNINQELQIDNLNKRIVELEIEQKNNTNFITKITSLENDVYQKQMRINELLNKIEGHAQNMNQMQHGYDAKIQERDLFIESLESEILVYKNRICRLEESISDMENRRHSLERKADQLDYQLQEKQKAYSEYTNQEDELINRLAVLMDHDRVLEKQLFEIENENKELQHRVQNLNTENHDLKKSLSLLQEQCQIYKQKAEIADTAETNFMHYQDRNRELESQLKKISHDYQAIIIKNKKDIEELESEFNNQIENAIKEKKNLSEKYEKVNEQVIQLEQTLLDYKTKLENLQSHISELTVINQQLADRLNAEQPKTPDYTEQYISEINRLHAAVNSKDQELTEVTSKSKSIQSSLQNEIAELHEKLHMSSSEIEKLTTENISIQQSFINLQQSFSQMEDNMKQLTERNKMTFEMSIPKTEGMIISSTIEALNTEPQVQKIDVSYLESQIVSDTQVETSSKLPAYFQKTSDVKENVEPLIIPKKSYLCYTSDNNTNEENIAPDTDPFNSEEGWGLGETVEETDVVMPGFTHFNEQIKRLMKDNDTLKSDLNASNAKLLKALKKLKELKLTNEMLSKELKLSKQVSQTSFLDSAIEDELKSNIRDLENKIEELNTELCKEKKEKEFLKKQNDVFSNANDRLTEIKERQDNEIEIWKCKFKQTNDKLESLQWEGEAKTPEHKLADPVNNDTRLKDEIIKLEKENEELQLIVDQLNCEKNNLLSEQLQLKSELEVKNNQLQLQKSTDEAHNILNNEYLALQKIHAEVRNEKEYLEQKILDTETSLTKVQEKYNKLKVECDNLVKTHEIETKELIEKCNILEAELRMSQSTVEELNSKVTILLSDIEEHKSALSMQQKPGSHLQETDAFMKNEKYVTMEDISMQSQLALNEANDKIIKLENDNTHLNKIIKDYEEQVKESESKIHNLNIENDKLLSTVAELRSSISAAMDQRGFEIAELWKQHLAQREADFQKAEQELRGQLSVAENKYEQLLDSFQCSNQEETNKLIMVEQVNALQSKLQDKDEHLVSLQTKYAETINQLDLLRSDIDDEKLMFENKLLSQREDYEKQIEDLESVNLQLTTKYDQITSSLQSEVDGLKERNLLLNSEVTNLTEMKSEMEARILDLTNQIILKDAEIHQKSNDYSIAFTQRNEEFEHMRQQLFEYEKKIEDLSFEKESELAILRLKIHEKKDYYEKKEKEDEVEKKKLAEELNAKVVECVKVNRQISELNKLLEEHSQKTNEMQAALENQEYEIVTLKDELNNLQELFKNSSIKIEKHVTFSSDTKPALDEESAGEALQKQLLDRVPRAELDLALYMLHQRDVRCEELTMELTQLLEERDTLQLRLSDSLRSFEELKSKCKSAGFEIPLSPIQETVHDVSSLSIENEQQLVDVHRGHSSRSSSFSDPDGDKPKLQAKLSELRSVRHSRDVTLRHESEQRDLGMRLLQRDVANLPHEAAEQLQQAHHTLSRDSQSTSTVLLNWFRGKSTPKAVQDM